MTPRIDIYKIHDAWRASLEQELKTARATLQEEREDHADAATAAWNERREDVAPLDPSSPADLRRAADLLEVLDVDWRPPGGDGWTPSNLRARATRVAADAAERAPLIGDTLDTVADLYPLSKRANADQVAAAGLKNGMSPEEVESALSRVMPADE